MIAVLLLIYIINIITNIVTIIIVIIIIIIIIVVVFTWGVFVQLQELKPFHEDCVAAKT